jgi:prepilin signal peptidase PulO-like enzyme (type II secretory pathway)
MLAFAVSPESIAPHAAGGIAFAAAGGLLGWAVAAGVSGIIHGIERGSGEPDLPSRSPSRAARLGFLVTAIVAAVGVYCWEVAFRGLGLAGIPSDGGLPAWPRAAAHLALFAFMAAAVWCDLEYRVIPDAITVPGAILGMLCVTAWPDLLLPVGWEQPRSYAPPLVEADVLGALGPLRGTAGSAWLAPAPSPWGLAALAAAFTAWWGVCTAPAAARTGWRDPRAWILPAGLAAVAAAWIAGGRDGGIVHFRAAEASLFGAVVSGGIVWLIREAASRALGREAMGLGDVTLMAMIGTWCGWQHGVLTFFAAAFIGLAQGLVAWVARRDHELPYGPSLCLAGAVVILAWRSVWERVSIHFEDPLLLFGAVAGVILLTALALAGWARVRP